MLAAEPPRRILIGFLGVSHSHALEKFKVVRESSEFELIGVVEDAEAVREPYARLGAKFISREELFARAEVVVVDSAVADHARDAKLALSVGKHVHVEKPPATTLREFEELVDLARAKKRLMQVGYMWRFNRGFNHALEAAHQGWLGEV